MKITPDAFYRCKKNGLKTDLYLADFPRPTAACCAVLSAAVGALLGPARSKLINT